jgi:hypothetical protein
MIVQINYNWNQARTGKFNADAVRKIAKRVVLTQAVKERRVVVGRGNPVAEIREWLGDNEVNESEFQMFGVFDDRPQDRMYFVGLAFEFKDSDSALFFKLRFG